MDEEYTEDIMNESVDIPTQNRSPRIIEYDSDSLNFLMHTIEDSYYENVLMQITSAKLSNDAKRRLIAIADEYNKPIEIVITNLRDMVQFKSQINAFRESAKLKKIGLRRIDAINGFFEIMVDIENHYRLKLTRSMNGFERCQQQTQKSVLQQEHVMRQDYGERKTGISRLIKGD